jgi:thymidylate synthase
MKLTRCVKQITRHPEFQYIDSIQNILRNGSNKNGRNGNTKNIFGMSMEFSLEDNTIPILTTKKLAWKTCLKELFWFINGETNNEILKKNNVNIWNQNASRDFLDSRNLNYEEDDLGPIYGHQWRYFNAEYGSCRDDYSGQGVDQLENIIKSLKDPTEKFSRRLVMSAWNPNQLNEMALPPCHVLTQFSVNNENELSCALYQRSGDIGLGIPFNIASYSFLTHILAKHCDLKAKKFVHFIGDAHIYDSHEEALKKQIRNNPFNFPKIHIKNKHDNINHYNKNDIEILNYKHHPNIKMNMIE